MKNRTAQNPPIALRWFAAAGAAWVASVGAAQEARPDAGTDARGRATQGAVAEEIIVTSSIDRKSVV